MTREPEVVRGEVVRGRFVDGRFVEDGEPAPASSPAAPALEPMFDAAGVLGAQLRDAAELLQRASAASQAYLGAWAEQLAAHGRKAGGGSGRGPTGR